MMKPILLSAAGNPENQDRGIFVQHGPRLLVCIADGAGGRSGGAEAACMVTEFIQQNVSAADTAESCADLLRRMDIALTEKPTTGESTCALAVITLKEIFGASVGDSGIWLIPNEGVHIDLTRGQQRKPLLGCGGAWPIGFRHPHQNGVLLLATDGLLKYTSSQRIVDVCRKHPVETAAKHLIELVRYRSGSLPDDVTVILTSLGAP
jgi:PPM family protein phosphatase